MRGKPPEKITRCQRLGLSLAEKNTCRKGLGFGEHVFFEDPRKVKKSPGPPAMGKKKTEEVPKEVETVAKWTKKNQKKVYSDAVE